MKHLLLLSILSLALLAPAAWAQNTTKSLKLQGVEMVESINDDGTDVIKRPYRWFAGMAEADVESVAVEMAQLEAYAVISRVIENFVTTYAERGTVANNGEAQKALKSHWQQMSLSLQKACEPFGDVQSTYNNETGRYEVIAKVGIRGDKYVGMLNAAKEAKPEGLSGNDLKAFTEANNAIIDAAKSN